jgi:hypothetical protein
MIDTFISQKWKISHNMHSCITYYGDTGSLTFVYQPHQPSGPSIVFEAVFHHNLEVSIFLSLNTLLPFWKVIRCSINRYAPVFRYGILVAKFV